MKIICTYILMGVLSLRVMAADPPFIKFARFKGDALVAVSLTFDDALKSQREKAVAILDRYDLPATFFLYTDNAAKAWGAWKEVAERGHELGSHTQTHPMLSKVNDPRWIRREIVGSADLIEEHTGVRPISFAYPFSDVDDALRRKVLSVYFVDRGSCRMWGGKDFSAKEGIANIKQAEKSREWFYCMMHGVDDESFRAISSKALDGIAQYLDKHRDTVWTATYGEVALYLKARRLARLQTRDVRADSFKLRLKLPPQTAYAEQMQVPLTLMVARDGELIKGIKAYCGDKPLVTGVARDGHYFLVDVVPDGRWVQVYWLK